MDVSVTLFGGLRHYLPAGSSFNHCRISVEDGATLDQLLERVPIPEDKKFLVIVNDERVAEQDYAGITLGADVEVVLLPPIKGG